MYRRIVLAYDGSLEGRIALREGGLLAKRLEAQVFLLAIIPIIPVVDALGASVVQSDPYAQEVFAEGLARAREVGLEVVGEIVQGDAAEQISAFAKQVNADLVIVGHRRKSFVERWWAGPGQAALIDKLDCTLLIARNAVSDEVMRAERESAQAQP